jgi:hypothetical protein
MLRETAWEALKTDFKNPVDEGGRVHLPYPRRRVPWTQYNGYSSTADGAFEQEI